MKPSSPDAEVQAFIDRYLEVSGLSTASTVAQQRRDYDAMLSHFRYPHPAGISTRDYSAPGPHGIVPLRRYQWQAGNDDALILFIHGGGFMLGSLDSHDDICAELCAQTGFDLVSVDYRLAPEHLHPVQLDDVEAAFSDCGHDNTILVGASAGGSLAAALCHRLRHSAHRPAAQLLIYPGLGGDRLDLDSYRDNATAPLLTSADIRFYRGIRTTGDELPFDDPEFYPLAAADFAATAATVAISADIDPLRDDAGCYVEKLRAAGVEAEWINEPGLVHDYLRARHVSRLAAAAFARIVAAITRLAG